MLLTENPLGILNVLRGQQLLETSFKLRYFIRLPGSNKRVFSFSAILLWKIETRQFNQHSARVFTRCLEQEGVALNSVSGESITVSKTLAPFL